MCKGLGEGKLGGVCGLPGHQDDDSPHAAAATTGSVPCELCGSRASLYCQADDAFLCRKCDKWVHGANFLARRHIRCFLCNSCQNLTQRYLIGASLEVVLPTML
ncbi:B-box domain protein 30-like [Corylus avellana]|nr:B-box domain protein 30-like [Corylus avellana]